MDYTLQAIVSRVQTDKLDDDEASILGSRHDDDDTDTDADCGC